MNNSSCGRNSSSSFIYFPFFNFCCRFSNIVPTFLLIFYRSHYLLTTIIGDFSDGPVVKNLPASAGNMGLIPGPGGSHMPQGNWTHASQLLRLRSATREATAIRSLHTTVQQRVLDWISAVTELIGEKREDVRGNSIHEWRKLLQWVRARAVMKIQVHQSAWVGLCCYNKPPNLSDLKQKRFISLLYLMSLAT